MNLNEAAMILRLSREEVRVAIEQGITLPSSKAMVVLTAHGLGTGRDKEYDIEDSDLDRFITAFGAEEPGRHPPVAVCRELLVEARHKCAICREYNPLEYHHIIEFSKLKHYDANHMLALCPTCHTKCTNGTIDRTAQRQYKHKLAATAIRQQATPTFLCESGPVRFSWDDLDLLIRDLHTVVVRGPASGESQFDYRDVDINLKNDLNHLGEPYFEVMRSEHEQYFQQIQDFLGDPMNSAAAQRYFEIVDELRVKIAAYRDSFDRFESILMRVVEAAINRDNPRQPGKRRVLEIVLSFMYLNCDIGRKH